MSIKRNNLKENDIQRALYAYTFKQNKKLWAHNIYLFNWESDFISVDNKGVIYEYEIKLTLNDFRADFKKRKHRIFTESIIDNGKPYAPNYFYFVCPAGVISKRQVPLYAGLIYVYPSYTCKVIKRPLQIHSSKRGFDKKILINIAKSLGHRWYS